MKKLSLLIVVFLVLGSFAFAQEEEAAASPLTATGSLSFSLGDSKAFDDTTTRSPGLQQHQGRNRDPRSCHRG